MINNDDKKINIFYRAYFFGFINCFFCPETSELYGQDKICDITISLFLPLAGRLFGSFPIKITNKMVSRRWLIEKYNRIKTFEEAKGYESCNDDYFYMK